MRRFLGLCLLLSPAWAAGQDCTSYVVVAAYEHKLGADLDNLKADDFEASAGNSVLPVVSARQNFSNRLLVLLETDGAAKNKKLGDMVDIATQWARQTPEGEPVAFGIFGKRALFTKGFIADPKERLKAINSVIEEASSMGKDAALFDSLHQGLELFEGQEPGDTVLLISDNFDDSSRRSASDLEKEFVSRGIRLFLILRQNMSRVGRDFNWRPHNEGDILARISRETGGAFSEFSPAFFRFAWAGYLVGVRVPMDEGRRHKLKIHLKGASEIYRRANLYYPDRLPACTPEPPAH